MLLTTPIVLSLGVDIPVPVAVFNNNTAFVNSSANWITITYGALNDVNSSQFFSNDGVLNVNESFFDGQWLNLSGGNANQDIDITPFDLRVEEFRTDGRVAFAGALVQGDANVFTQFNNFDAYKGQNTADGTGNFLELVDGSSGLRFKVAGATGDLTSVGTLNGTSVFTGTTTMTGGSITVRSELGQAILLFGGTGGTNNEDITLDFESTADLVTLASTTSAILSTSQLFIGRPLDFSDMTFSGNGLIIAEINSGPMSVADGSLAVGGSTGGGSIITAGSRGTIAFGVAAGGDIITGVSRQGAFAGGYALTNDIIADDEAAFAYGFAGQGDIIATGQPSMAVGEDITTSGDNSYIFGLGFDNTEAETFKVGFGGEIFSVNSIGVNVTGNLDVTSNLSANLSSIGNVGGYYENFGGGFGGSSQNDKLWVIDDTPGKITTIFVAGETGSAIQFIDWNGGSPVGSADFGVSHTSGIFFVGRLSNKGIIFRVNDGGSQNDPRIFASGSRQRVGFVTEDPKATADVNGSFATFTRHVSSDYTIVVKDSLILVNASAGEVTITLRDINTFPTVNGIIYQVKKIDDSINKVIIQTGDVAQFIEGQINYNLTEENQLVEFQSDDLDQWFIISHSRHGVFDDIKVFGPINMTNNTINEIFCLNGSNGDQICFNDSIDFFINDGLKMVIGPDNTTLFGDFFNFGDINDTSSFVETNLNNGTRATAGYTAKNNVGQSVTFGITSSNFEFVNSTINFSSTADIIALGLNNFGFINGRQGVGWVWLGTDSAIPFTNLTEPMSLTYDGALNVSSNITTKNVTIQNYLHFDFLTEEPAPQTDQLIMWADGNNFFAMRDTGQKRKFVLGGTGSITLDEKVIFTNITQFTHINETFTGGSAHVCIYNNGTLFTSEGACP